MEYDQNMLQREKLRDQIRDSFGRIVYNQTCHEKKLQSLVRQDNCIKKWQIILSALATTGFIGVVIFDEKIAGFIGAFISFILVILNSYSKNFTPEEKVQDHRSVALQLWEIREDYKSLLTDFDYISIEEIKVKREELKKRTCEVYNVAHRTDEKSYLEARKSLKEEEEQTFTNAEIDSFLPPFLRKDNMLS